LELIEKQRREGLDVTQDQYGYTASSTGIAQLVPESAREGGKFPERIKDWETKAKVIREMKDRLQTRGEKDYAYAVIANFEDKSLNGLNIPQAALKLRGKDDLEAQIETILEIVGKGGASGVFHGMSEEDLRTFLRHPNTMVACDSGLRVFGEGVPHPRGYGNNARILGRYVREERILRLEEAVRKMSSLPARTFGLKNRGQIAEGFAADLVIFDDQKILDKATFSHPHQYPEGIDYVLVNGTVAVELGEFKGGMGEGLRRNP
jgi:N-acyl-D-amino-acid deacylase